MKKSLSKIKRVISQETRKKLSESAKRNKFGGHTSRFGIYYECKDGKKVYLQSSYEVIIANELDKHNVSWIRPEPLLWVNKNDEEHLYYPDFYLSDHKVYLDPKNDYLIKKDADKINRVQTQNNIRVFVLSKDTLNWNDILKLIKNGKNIFCEVVEEKENLICLNCDKKVNPYSKKQLCKDCYIESSKKHYYCSCCNIQMKRKTKTSLCIECFKKREKENSIEHIPVSRLQLIDLILNQPFTKIGEVYNVSDNAVRKWCKSYGLPYRTSDIKAQKEQLLKELEENSTHV